MRFRQIAAALLACTALGALAANAAQAGQWTIGTEEDQTEAGAKLTGPETVKIEKHPGTELALSTKILGAPVTLTAGNVQCWMTCAIETTSGGTDKAEGSLQFTEVKMTTPSNCSVPGNSFVTKRLTQQGIMDSSTAVLNAIYNNFDPEAQRFGPIVFFEFEGNLCPLAGVVAELTGVLCGEVVHTVTPGTYKPSPTGTLLKIQTVRFGKAQQETGGGFVPRSETTNMKWPCALKVGAAEGWLTGAVDNELTGTNKAKPYGAD